jgi:hypothetical protein
LVFFINNFGIYRAAKWTAELSTRVENLAYEKSGGIKVNYLENKN